MARSGAFVGGSSALYPLGTMAKSGDAIVVSFNYRLGVFGFMSHPSFEAAYNGAYGIEDQRAALRWVRRNIAAFGGDPDNVTIAGESAGAASVCMHVISPNETAGLFQRAIVQSAGCIQHLRTVEESGKIGQQVAALVGCGVDAAALACMRAKPVKALLEAAAKVSNGDVMTYAPSAGTQTIPLQGAEAMRSGRFVHVPMIIGGNRDELRLYVAYGVQAGRPVTADNYLQYLKAAYGSNAAAVQQQYSDANAPPVTPDPGFEMGAVHSAELPYQFPHFSNTTQLDGPALAPASQELAGQMMAYWTRFASAGSPRAPHGPLWTPYRSHADVMRLEPGKSALFDAYAAHRCGFWRALYPDILQ